MPRTTSPDPISQRVESATDQRAHNKEHGDRRDAGRRQNQPGVVGVVPEQGLQQRGERRARAVQHGIGAKDDDAAGCEIALGERPEVDHGIGNPQFPKDQGDRPSEEQNGQRLHAPERIAEPVPLLPFAEHDFPRGHRQRQETETDVVEIERLFQEIRSLGFEISGIVEQEVARHERQRADRQIDIEDPAPVVIIREVAAQRRPDDRREQGGDAEHRHGRSLLLPREGIQQDALAAGLQSAAGQPLQHAEQDQLIQAGRHAAQTRAERENADRQHKVVAATEAGGKPAADRQDGGVGRQVTGDHPLAVDDGRRQAAGDIPQRDVGDRRVQHFHEGGHHHDRGHHPRVHHRSHRRAGERDRAHGTVPGRFTAFGSAPCG